MSRMISTNPKFTNFNFVKSHFATICHKICILLLIILGKTSTIQHLVTQCGHSLRVINMSQQSDSADLLGGFKPVDMKQLVTPLRETFETIFCQTFSRKQNVKFLSHLQQCFAKSRWEMLFKMMLHCQKAAMERIKNGLYIL